MTNRDDAELDRLLAKGQFKRPEQERILEDVISAVHQEEPVRKTSWLFSFRFAPIAAALLIAVILPGAWYLTRPESGFRPKGAAGGPAIQAACTDVCRAGDKVLFQLKGLKEPAFFAAYATSPDGARMIWYFPTESGKAIGVDPQEGWTVLQQGVRIGPEHGTGVHTVHFLLLDEALDRNALRQALSENSPHILVRKKQLLEISP